MEKPRVPNQNEFSKVIDFLNQELRKDSKWSISTEYPTALTNTNLHNMRIVTKESEVVAHGVLKPHIIKTPQIVYKVGAIGSVVTSANHRSQGYSSAVIRDCVDLATKQECDIVILWTNLFDFYRKFGFELAGSEVSLILEKPLPVGESKLNCKLDSKVSPEAILRLFSQHSVVSSRTLEDMKKYLAIPNTNIFTAWEPDGSLAAYAIEGKGADLGGYIHEWGGKVSKIITLLSFIQKNKPGNLTLIAPQHSINLINQLTEIGASINRGYLGMIKITQFDQLATKIKKAFRNIGIMDIVLEKQGGSYVFGCDRELFTLPDEKDLTRLLFGPYDMAELDIFPGPIREKLGALLPLPLWIWGWDSI